MALTSRAMRNSATMTASTLVVARRSLMKYFRTPQLVVLSSLQGALFFLMYRYVFGGAISVGVPYVDFLFPGFIATMVLFVGMGTSVGVAEDMGQGFVDRLRSLPIPRSAILAGRALADTAELVWSLLVMAAVGFAAGFRFHGSLTEALAALGLCIVFGFAFEWLFIALGAIAGGPQAAQGVGLLVFPLTFVSSAYVPVQSMPGWLRVFADHQPITMMVDAVRALALGPDAGGLLDHGTAWYVTGSLVWTAVILAVSVPLAVSRFRPR